MAWEMESSTLCLKWKIGRSHRVNGVRKQRIPKVGIQWTPNLLQQLRQCPQPTQHSLRIPLPILKIRLTLIPRSIYSRCAIDQILYRQRHRHLCPAYSRKHRSKFHLNRHRSPLISEPNHAHLRRLSHLRHLHRHCTILGLFLSTCRLPLPHLCVQGREIHACRHLRGIQDHCH